MAIVALTLLLARPIAVFAALSGTKVDAFTKGFMAWFGPKGVATMAFSLFVLGKEIPSGERIFNLAALVVFASIIVHGLTDTPGANWIGRRHEESEEDAAQPEREPPRRRRRASGAAPPAPGASERPRPRGHGLPGER